MAEFGLAFARSAAIVFCYMTAWFVVGTVIRRNDIVDSAWGIGFVLLAVDAAFFANDPTWRSVLMVLLVGLWGIRLAVHVSVRNLGKSEDFRYAAWRRDWGRWFLPRMYLQVFLVQGLFMWLISGSITVVGRAEATTLGTLDVIAIAVFAVGFLFEAIGDYQLYAFKNDPVNAGHVMSSGVWRYTRHPNYFGEVTLWWGIWLVALSVPYGAYAIISPVTVWIHRYCSTPSRMRSNIFMFVSRSAWFGNSATILRAKPRRDARMKPR